MTQLLQAFVLGNGAILSNVCLLPLYPGLVAFLAGTSRGRERAWTSAALGATVLAGVLVLMLLVALLLTLLRASFAGVLPWLLPASYAVVGAFGLLLLVGRNPFERLALARAPALRHRFASAFLYGLLLGPMTLPCTGPIVLGAFVLGFSQAGYLAGGVLYFLAFGVGFGWPLVVLPLVAAAAQRRLQRWLTRRHGLLERASGVLLLGIAVAGLALEVVPNLS